MGLTSVSYAASVLLSFTFGIYFVLSLFTWAIQIRRLPFSTATRNARGLICFNAFMLVVNTVFFITMVIWAKEQFMGDPNSVRLLGLVKNAMNVLNIWGADALIVFRLWAIWGESWKIVLLPCALLLGVVATGIMFLVQSSTLHHDLISSDVYPQEHFGLVFWSISVCLNILVTCLIIGRMTYHRRIVRAMAPYRKSPSYNGIAVKFVESAALYTLLGIIYMILVAKNIPAQLSVGVVFNASAAIAPNLIMIRVALSSSPLNEGREPVQHINASTPITPLTIPEKEQPHISLGVLDIGHQTSSSASATVYQRTSCNCSV
ncbi:hypothetical protein AX16_004028 [Volvariella volvacea WC 439]|nr:hypothetical protein AX16_004028 [Volvariella volvacea WC 439]